jgi:hypothetical protein
MTSWRAWPWALGLSCGVVLLHLWLRQCPSEVGPVFSGISMGFPICLSRAFRVQLDVFFNGKSMDVMACWDFPWISARVVVYVFCCSNF